MELCRLNGGASSAVLALVALVAAAPAATAGPPAQVRATQGEAPAPTHARAAWAALPVALAGLDVLAPGAVLAAAGGGAVAAGGLVLATAPRWPNGALRPFPGERVEAAQARVSGSVVALVVGPAVALLGLGPLLVGSGLLVAAAVVAGMVGFRQPGWTPPAAAACAPPPPGAPLDVHAPQLSDADTDGLADRVDACPQEAGAVDNRGCPLRDADGDGLADDEDRCPQVAGTEAGRGCPAGDADGDGLADNIDRCPAEAGPSNTGGCPGAGGAEAAAEPLDPRCMDPTNLAITIRGDQIEIPTMVQFAPGTATLLASSVGVLDQVALTLRCRTDIQKLRLEGHTDSSGGETLNSRLSLDRARAVLEYLATTGGISRARLDAEGRGATRPVASDADEKGREKNRRVEFVIVEVAR